MKATISVCVITYNHEAYIAECIENILSQKKCKFEIIIGEDQSTDKTLEICRYYQKKFPKIVKLLPSNKKYGMMNNFFRVLSESSGKYIALCEGDDYWTDPLKLHKQVTLLEKHPECSMSFHAYEHIKDNEKIGKITRANSTDLIFSKNKLVKIATRYSQTATLLFRSEYVQYLPKWCKNAPIGDIPLKLILLYNGRAAYINDVMSAYRVQSSSSYSKRVRNDINKFISVKTGKSKMWREFNKYSNYEFNDDVIEQIMICEMQIPIDQNVLSRLAFFIKNTHRQMINQLPLKRKIKILLICLALIIDPNLRQRKYFYNNPFKKYFYKI